MSSAYSQQLGQIICISSRCEATWLKNSIRVKTGHSCDIKWSLHGGRMSTSTSTLTSVETVDDDVNVVLRSQNVFATSNFFAFWTSFAKNCRLASKFCSSSRFELLLVLNLKKPKYCTLSTHVLRYNFVLCWPL